MAGSQHAAAGRKNKEVAAGDTERGNALYAEITGADKLGIWITVNGMPYFVAHEKTCWLRAPAVLRMLNMSLLNGFHLRCDSLDEDIGVDEQ